MAVLGALVGAGVMLAAAGLRGHAVVAPPLHTPLAARVDRIALRLACGASGAVVVTAATHWPVAGVAAALTLWSAPDMARGRDRHRREIARTEAIATWTEQLRDTLAAASGLEQAIAATAAVAPAALSGPIARLAGRAAYEPLSGALRQFAEDVDSPLADFVVAALVIATEREARDVGPLLGHLADCARDDARMRSRVWVSRARTRSATRIITAAIAIFVAGLLVLNRAYLAPYDSPGGQVVLAGVITAFAVALMAMRRLGQLTMPDRFIARRSA